MPSLPPSMPLWRHLAILLALTSAAPAVGQAPPRPAVPWRQLALADLEQLHRSVLDLHPAMRDPDTPDFPRRVEVAYRQARLRAAAARSYLDWRTAVQGFVLSFRDGHTIFRPAVLPARVRWPGFLLDGRGGSWVVRRPSTPRSTDSLPIENSELVACDGIAAADVLRRRLDGVEADWSKEPERIRQAFRLLIDYHLDGAPPIQRCTFNQDGVETVVELAWRIESWTSLAPELNPLLRLIKRPIEARTLPSGGRWITLGSFGLEAQLAALVGELTADSLALRRVPFVVFDLRGNRGGNSTWGEQLAQVLWGDSAASARSAALAAESRGHRGKWWRASPAAARAVRAVAVEFAARGAAFADVARYWYETADRLAHAPDGDRQLVHDPCCDAEDDAPPSSDVMPRFGGRAYVLVDAGCFSSCVLAANRLIAQGAVAIGETSGQNEEYGEIVTPPPLPSGLASYSLPVSIIRQDHRALRVIPQERWPGAMDDDRGLEDWVAHLAQER